jgi:hypothetical protein
MRAPTTTQTGPVACRRRTPRKRSRGPEHSHKNWTYWRGPLSAKSFWQLLSNFAGYFHGLPSDLFTYILYWYVEGISWWDYL